MADTSSREFRPGKKGNDGDAQPIRKSFIVRKPGNPTTKQGGIFGNWQARRKPTTKPPS